MAALSTTPLLVGQPHHLVEAIACGVPHIEVRARIGSLPRLTLRPGQTITGVGSEAMLVFDQDGIELTADNSVTGLGLVAPAHRRAIFVSESGRNFGTLRLKDLVCSGQVQCIFGKATRQAYLELDHVCIASADTSQKLDSPEVDGIGVLQGAVTIWNCSTAASDVTLDLKGVEIGARDHPVVGSGLLISGSTAAGGGAIAIAGMAIGEIYCSSPIAAHVRSICVGGVTIMDHVVVNGAIVTGSIVTHGHHAIAIDNHGTARRWLVNGDAISHGPGAAGFRNCGSLDELEISGTIETFGSDAPAFAIHGPVGTLKAGSIRTHGPSATGVHIADRVESLHVNGGIFTGTPCYTEMRVAQGPQGPSHCIHIAKGGQLGRLVANPIRASGIGARQLLNEGLFGESSLPGEDNAYRL